MGGGLHPFMGEGYIHPWGGGLHPSMGGGGGGGGATSIHGGGGGGYIHSWGRATSIHGGEGYIHPLGGGGGGGATSIHGGGGGGLHPFMGEGYIHPWGALRGSTTPMHSHKHTTHLYTHTNISSTPATTNLLSKTHKTFSAEVYWNT